MAPKELTLRGLILGCLITTVFTAANVYLGLKVGLTFASSIPAAVISMAILSAVKDSSILENNIVQTVASAAGTLSSIIFVLPGLVIIGWWVDFPFWQSFLVNVAGGILGVIFTIPLRRALVTHSDLPYPEGVAAAEVLKVGSETRGESKADPGEAREGLTAVVLGTLASAGLAIVGSTRIFAAEVTGFFSLGAFGSSGYNIAWSLALFGAGHLVGLSVGLAMFVGLFMAWGIAVPVLTHLNPLPDGVSMATHTLTLWRTQVRFIGAGAIGISAIWTLITLVKPVVGGLISTISSSHGRATGDERDRDIGINWIVALAIGCLLLTAWMAYDFVGPTALAPHIWTLTLIAVPFVFIVGFIIAGVAGYMAGLIGASNSPVSGIGILAVVTCGSILVIAVPPTVTTSQALVAFALFLTGIVFSCATISNDNLQDLKTGQLVGASPMRQQIALIVGVFAGSASIPPVLNLLAKAYGFAGAANIGVVAANPLPAPQATLISALAQGVIGGSLNWNMIGLGATIGIAVIVLDRVLGAMGKMRLPPLAVGMGIYLPMSATFAVFLGALVVTWYDKVAKRARQPERADRLGTLVASGLIVGESLFGVLNAGLIVGFNRDAPLALVAEDFSMAPILGLVGFAALVFALYSWLVKKAVSSPSSG